MAMRVPTDYPAAFADEFQDSTSVHDLTVSYELGCDSNDPRVLALASAFTRDIRALVEGFNDKLRKEYPYETDETN